MHITYFNNRLQAEAFALFNTDSRTRVSIDRAGAQYMVVVETLVKRVVSKPAVIVVK